MIETDEGQSDYVEGSEAAARFGALVRKVLSVSHEEIMRREEEYKRLRAESQTAWTQPKDQAFFLSPRGRSRDLEGFLLIWPSSLLPVNWLPYCAGVIVILHYTLLAY